MSEATIRRVDVKLGFSCNNRCRFCVQGDKRDRYIDRTTQQARDELTSAREWADEVVLTGGEVTVRHDLPELVAHARDLGFRVIQLQTNGRVLSQMSAMRALRDAGATEVSPAVHGPDSATHDALTRRPGSFRQTLRGIRNARLLGLPVLVNSVVTRANFARAVETAELLVALDVQQFQFAFVHPLGTAAELFDEVVPRLSEAAPHLVDGALLGARAGVTTMLEGVPLCFLPGHELLAAEFGIPRTRIIDADQVVEDYTEARIHEGKAKGPRCASCTWDSQCEGPWREYPETFGWDEFVPVQ